MDAETWFYFQDYKNSLPLYLRLNRQYPDNDNVNYKIGFCYLNLDGLKDKAIPYLKNASENTTFNFSRESFYEKKAPVDALFYLGNAYLINNQIDKALEAYKQFREKIEGKRGLLANNRKYDLEYLRKQIESCRNAREMMNNPVSFSASNLGRPINTPLSEYNPVISGDGKTIVFTAEKKFYTGIFMSKKKNGKWGVPINLLPQLGIDGDCETTSISKDGKELYLYREDDLDGNLYVSHFKNGSWSNIKKLGQNINTEYWESHAYISRDGEKLYFTSNRPGGYGDLDIYVAERNNDGSWGEPSNLGPTINTPWREDTPFLTGDGKNLFFSSEGHHNMGGFDVVVAFRKENGWSNPQNLGYPINTTDHDRFFVPLENGNRGYYARYHRNPPGGRDIFRYRIDLPEHLDYIDVEGILTYDNPKDQNKQEYLINVIDRRDNDTLVTLNPDEGTGHYEYKLNEKQDHLIMETPWLENDEQYLLSKKINIKEKYLQPLQIAEKEPKKEPAEPLIRMDNQLITARPGQGTIPITMQLEGGKQLQVKTYRDDSLLNTESFSVRDDEFTYHYKPGQKPERLSFTLSGDEGRTITKDVNIQIASLQAEKEHAEEDSARLEITDRSFSIEEGRKQLRLSLELDEGSRLIVSTYVDDQLVNREEFTVEQDSFTYDYTPREKKSRLAFKVIDPRERVNSKKVTVNQRAMEQGLERLLSGISRYNADKLVQRIRALLDQDLSPGEFLRALYDQNRKPALDPSEVDALLYSLILLHEDTPAELIDQLNDLASGKLQSYLEYLAGQDLQSKKELLQKLRAAAGKPSYTEGDLRDLLIQYLEGAYQPERLYQMALTLSGLDPDTMIREMDYSTTDIVSVGDLLEYLRHSDLPEKEALLALLEGVEISATEAGIDKQLALQSMEEEEEGPPTRYWPYYLIGGLALLFVLFLFIRRKRKRDQNEK